MSDAPFDAATPDAGDSWDSSVPCQEPDTCNGVDDDCDGFTDNDGTNACGGSCALGPLFGMPCDGSDTDLCTDDTYVCLGLNAVICSAGLDEVEICNGSDDDCLSETFEGTDADGDGFCADTADLACCPGTSDLDCCDADPLVRPDATGWFTAPSVCGNFDYDCDGLEELENESTMAYFCLCGGYGCGGTTAWVEDVPPCGESGDYSVYVGPTCQFETVTHTQGCH